MGKILKHSGAFQRPMPFMPVTNPVEYIVNPLSWFDEETYCTTCKKTYTGIFCHIGRDRICETCSVVALHQQLKRYNINTWPVERFKEALTKGNLSDRLTVLFDFSEVSKLAFKKTPSDLKDLLTLCVRNLGYTDIHPLARQVRQAAFMACLEVGADILPVVLAEVKQNQWIYYVNLVKLAGHVAPDNLQVRELVNEAVTDRNSFVAAQTIAYFNLLNSSLKSMILKTVSSAPHSSMLQQLIDIINNPPASIKTPDQLNAVVHNLTLLKPLEVLVSEAYDNETLKKLYTAYTRDFLSEDHFLIENKVTVSKLRKTIFARALSMILSDQELIQKLLNMLSPDVKKILNLLVWEGGEHDVETLEKLLNIEIFKSTQKNEYGRIVEVKTVKDDYLLFLGTKPSSHIYHTWSDQKISLYLSDSLRELFKSYLPVPKDYTLAGMDKVEPSLLVFEDRDEIFTQIKVLFSYIHQGNLVYTKTGKILKGTLSQMARVCQIREFYEKEQSSDGELLRTRLMLDALTLLKSSQKNIDDPIVFLKALFEDFFGPVDSYTKYLLRELLFHLKGIHNLRGGYLGQEHSRNEATVRASLLNFFRSIAVSKWFRIEDVIKNMLYRSMSVEIISKSTAYSYLHFLKPDEEVTRYTSYNKTSILSGMYHDTVAVPCIKAAMFVFASFGLLDIAYRAPKNPLFQLKDKEYLSVFDGLEYIRLTELGAYIFGLTQTYEVKIKEEKAKATLDEQRLILTLDKTDLLKSMILDQIADKISDTCYKVSYQSFLRECRSDKELKNKIQLFKQTISSELPSVWKAFFDELNNRVNPLNEVQGMVVYKLKEDRELAELMARDEVLKKYILKAENYHIVVSEKDKAKVLRRLEEFGFFVGS
ncbi:MAG TPA: hypothetical protein VJL89_09810 [Thermodesulfovibrionia bacterium]|nr:hypothetical protein [Thermodesulfovibrionia bacterium]